MRIGISTSLERFGDERYKKLREFGFDCLDMNLADTKALPYTLSDGDFAEWCATEKRLADEAGVQINQVHGPWQWPLFDSTPEERAERLEKMKRATLAASLVGADYMVIHPLMPYGIDDRADAEKSADTFRLNVEFMRELASYGAECGVTVCLENMPFPKFSITTPEDIVRVIDAVNMPSFKMCLDLGHAVMFKEWQPAVALRRYADYIRVLHVHDNNGKEDQHYMPMYRGIVDWSDFARAMREVGFSGVFSFECAPSGALPSPIYEELFCLFGRLAKHIIDMK